MLNQVVGFAAIAVAAVCVAAAVVEARRGRHHLGLVFVMTAGLALRIYMGTDLFLHLWDERFHALVARNLLAHPLVPTLYDDPALPFDYRNWLANHVWLHKPPLALWLAAGSMGVFGINEIALRVPSIVVSTLGIALTYSIGAGIFGPRVGLLAALFDAGNGFLIEFAGGRKTCDHVDALYVVLIEAAFAAALAWSRRPRGRVAALAGLFVGLAVLTKWWPALLVLLLMLVLARGERPARTLARHVGLAALVAAALAGAWLAYIYRAFPVEAAAEASAATRHLTAQVEGMPTAWWFYPVQMPRFWGELVYLPLGWWLLRVAKRQASRPEQALAAWVVVPFVVLSFAVSKSPSYLMIAAPALFVLQASFWDRLLSWRFTGWRAWGRRALLALLLLSPFRYGVEKLAPRPRDRNPSWAQALRALDRQLPARAVLFGTDHPIEAMFSTGYTAYAVLPTPEQVDALLAQGRQVAVCREKPLPSSLLQRQGIVAVSCGE